MVRRCFVCNKHVVSALDGSEESEFTDPPNKATCWSTQGNFGSAVYDEPTQLGCSKQLEIWICDECLLLRKDRVVEFDKVVQVEYKVEKWNPNA